jgi:hypothetical protein
LILSLDRFEAGSRWLRDLLLYSRVGLRYPCGTVIVIVVQTGKIEIEVSLGVPLPCLLCLCLICPAITVAAIVVPAVVLAIVVPAIIVPAVIVPAVIVPAVMCLG